jgi:tRNA (guanine-N7-)-methyltransferase
MQKVSRAVDSNQNEVHRQLLKVLKIHLNTEYRLPISTYSRSTFSLVDKIRKELNKPLILDSGCGTGHASKLLATANPDRLIIGVDKSSHRLAKGGLGCNFELLENCLLLKMNLVDFWRLAVEYGWKLEKHYLLYPNPWPKAKHLRRRWHAHPVFPQLLKLGGELELRCNWKLYAEEFQAAMNFIAPGSCILTEYRERTGISLFEQKYLRQGHQLYRCHCFLDKKSMRI